MILGVDTSCYTTSLAVVDENAKLLADCRQLLPVKEGSRGLAQSEAFFSHVNQLPLLLTRVFAEISPRELTAIGVSNKPRSLPDSYMPVFRAGESLAKALSVSLGIPLYFTSHQDGHLAAALWSAACVWEEPFLAVHISGGTTELLLVRPQSTGFCLQIVGDCDLAAGQFVDRVGVNLGLPFPAGPHLEALALRSEGSKIKLPVAVQGSKISFSGPQSAADRLLAQGAEPKELALAVFFTIGESLVRAVAAAISEYNLSRVIFMGGVAANSLVKAHLTERLASQAEVVFADKQYSGDNAVGVAVFASRMQNSEAE
ncbi:MAG: O-sialoglycoprotein endopeptidase [Clostridiales bacterium]|jgi:N6-L-threonylcarbamoyladenine synthase|nr:O-sialoglycoprotein endopeptidase [Clostridiales bacterium]MDR2713365.1 O-sialoglycoprotein endopeptidase [Clostridiales bacterium]